MARRAIQASIRRDAGGCSDAWDPSLVAGDAGCCRSGRGVQRPAPRASDRAAELHRRALSADRAAGGAARLAGHVRQPRLDDRGRPDGAQRQLRHHVAARGVLRGPPPEGREARGPARGAADALRLGGQPADGAGAGVDAAAPRAAAGDASSRAPGPTSGPSSSRGLSTSIVDVSTARGLLLRQHHWLVGGSKRPTGAWVRS